MRETEEHLTGHSFACKTGVLILFIMENGCLYTSVSVCVHAHAHKSTKACASEKKNTFDNMGERIYLTTWEHDHVLLFFCGLLANVKLAVQPLYQEKQFPTPDSQYPVQISASRCPK